MEDTEQPSPSTIRSRRLRQLRRDQRDARHKARLEFAVKLDELAADPIAEEWRRELRRIAHRFRRKPADGQTAHIESINDFAADMEALADRAPDVSAKADLRRARFRLRLRHILDAGQQRGAVMSAIQTNGASTWTEIREETGLSLMAVRTIISHLVNTGQVRRFTRAGKTHYEIAGALQGSAE